MSSSLSQDPTPICSHHRGSAPSASLWIYVIARLIVETYDWHEFVVCFEIFACRDFSVTSQLNGNATSNFPSFLNFLVVWLDWLDNTNPCLVALRHPNNLHLCYRHITEFQPSTLRLQHQHLRQLGHFFWKLRPVSRCKGKQHPCLLSPSFLLSLTSHTC